MTKLVESNLLSFFLNLRYWDKAELHLTPSLWWSKTPVNHPVFNAVHRSRLTASTLQQAVEVVKVLDVPVIWRVWQDSRPTSLANQLEAGGFAYHGSALAMVVDLARACKSRNLPAGVDIKQAENLSDFLIPFSVGFNMPGFVTAAYLDYYSQVPPHVPLRHFVGWIGGTPVTSASLWLDGEVAGIYNVATIPEARNRGVGTAMSLWVMQQARESGCKVATLQASPEGSRVYKRLGFGCVCEVGHYVYDPCGESHRLGTL